ncbi:MAG: DUF2147 domain-containing protein [Rudaea sp.]|nr:DUF2147 domain-containing protein [Rudaea sp.]
MYRLLPLAILACLHPGNALADAVSPVGTWKTIDDETHEARSLVQISENDGVLSGRVIRLFRKPDEDPNPRCKDCPGERHDQPVIGMTILWNEHRHGDGWDGGEILDPEDGDIYRCSLHAIDGGAKLEVHGYIGIPLLGRTQVWERVPT